MQPSGCSPPLCRHWRVLRSLLRRMIHKNIPMIVFSLLRDDEPFQIWGHGLEPVLPTAATMQLAIIRWIYVSPPQKDNKFWGFMDPSDQNEQYHTTPHYYPKYEIWAIDKKLWCQGSFIWWSEHQRFQTSNIPTNPLKAMFWLWCFSTIWFSL